MRPVDYIRIRPGPGRVAQLLFPIPAEAPVESRQVVIRVVVRHLSVSVSLSQFLTMRILYTRFSIMSIGNLLNLAYSLFTLVAD